MYLFEVPVFQRMEVEEHLEVTVVEQDDVREEAGRLRLDIVKPPENEEEVRWRVPRSG